MKRVGIIGASGYTGFELVKILTQNSGIEVVVLNSENACGKKVTELYPEFDSRLEYTNFSLADILAMNLDCIFLAREHGYAKHVYNQFSCSVIDLSHDLRFQNGSVYGLPELFRNRMSAPAVIANPGCYATASILAAYPLIRTGNVEHVIFDCKSGYSGAGKTPSYLNTPEHFRDNIIPYKIADHQHLFEITECLRISTGKSVKVSFTPHVIPVFRGILCTAHILTKESLTQKALIDLYQECFEHEPFVDVRPDSVPELHDVQHTNFCHVGGFQSDDTGRVVVITAIDNLLKGASGQAVQNMNILFNFAETTSLT